MVDSNILDNFVDDREFRNYVVNLMPCFGYEVKRIDDVRISDGIETNDNDLICIKDNKKYTLQTFLNKTITENEINEAIVDMKKEKIKDAIIVSNTPLDKDVKDLAINNNIIVIDRDDINKVL